MSVVNWSNVTDLGNVPAQANVASDGLFWSGMLYMIWIVLILILIAYGFEVALLVSSFLGLIIAILLVYSGLVAWYHAVVFAGIILFIFLYIIWSSKKQ